MRLAPISIARQIDVGHGAGGVVDSQAFADWLSTRPKMGWPRIPRRKKVEAAAEPIDGQSEILKQNRNRAALLTALMAIDEDD